MPAFHTPAGYLPEGLPDRAPPASLVYAKTREGIINVFVMRPTADPPEPEAIKPHEQHELETVASFSMDTDQFIDLFGGILDDLMMRREVDGQAGYRTPDP